MVLDFGSNTAVSALDGVVDFTDTPPVAGSVLKIPAGGAATESLAGSSLPGDQAQGDSP